MNLALVNGVIYTFNPDNPVASSMAIKCGRIVYIGDDDMKALKLSNSSRIIDLNGKVVLPTFVDAHIHLSSLALSHLWLDLRHTRSIEELKEIIKRVASKTVTPWILGRGWDQERFIEKRMPTRWDIDEAVPHKPVLLIRVCGHIAVANTKALELCGLLGKGRDMYPLVDVVDGKITGILREQALDHILKYVPKPRFNLYLKLLSQTLNELLSYGIGLVSSMCVENGEFRALQKLNQRSQLKVKVRLYFNSDYTSHLVKLGVISKLGDVKLRIMGIKTFVDGSFGGRTAALREPYSDDPLNKGELLLTHDNILKLFKRVAGKGLDIAIHCIGDKAMEETILALKKVNNSIRSKVRIEHASLTPPDIISELRNYKPKALVVQPHFIVSDWWIEQRLGPRVKYAYAFKSLIESGLLLAGSSDAPVEPANPWLSIRATVDRSHEALTLNEALTLYTYGGRVALSEEYPYLSVGAPADIQIYNKDPFKVPIKLLNKLKPQAVIMEGKTVYGVIWESKKKEASSR